MRLNGARGCAIASVAQSLGIGFKAERRHITKPAGHCRAQFQRGGSGVMRMAHTGEGLDIGLLDQPFACRRARRRFIMEKRDAPRLRQAIRRRIHAGTRGCRCDGAKEHRMGRVAVPPIHPSGNWRVKREGDLAGSQAYGARYFCRISTGEPCRRRSGAE